MMATKKTDTLRNIPRSDRYFWQTSQSEQWSLTVMDKSADGNLRALPKNELAVMALNEIAASFGRGYFFHLRNKDFWKKPPNAELCPEDRVPATPGASYPEILYMNFVWDESTRAKFLTNSHRARYLNADALMNLPFAATPLYAIQFAATSNYPIYATELPSLVVLATEQTFYMIDSVQMEKVVGKWNKKRQPSGQDPKLRFNTVPYMWSNDLDEEQTASKQKLEPFRVGELESLYRAVTAKCAPQEMPATFSAGAFRQMSVPRPVGPTSGLPLGTPPDDSVFQSSKAASRRGSRKKRKTDLPGEKAKSDVGSDQ